MLHAPLSFQKAPSIFPKFFPNPSEIHPKSIQNRSKILKNRFKIAPKIDLKSRKRPERDFFNFLLIFGAPGASQNRAKIMKNREKAMKNRCQENTWLSTPFFLDFSWFWPPQTSPKSRFFRICFEDVDFLKISKNHWKKQWLLLIFQGRSPQKSTKNRCQNAFAKNIAKNDPKIDFGVRV